MRERREIKKLHYLLLLYVFTLSFENLFGEDTIWPPYRIVGMVLIGCWLIWMVIERRSLRLDAYDGMLLFIFIFLGSFCLVLQNFVDQVSFAHFRNPILLIGFGLTTYFAVKNLGLSARMVKLVLWCFVAGALINAFEILGAFSPTVYAGRLTGYSENANTAGYNCGLALTMVLGSYIYRRNHRLGHFALTALFSLVLIAGLVPTQSRGALISCGIAVMIMLSMALSREDVRSRGLQVVGLVLLLALSALILIGMEGQISSRLTSRFTRTGTLLSGRDEIWAAGYAIAEDFNFRGIGFGQFFHLSGGYYEKQISRHYGFGATGPHSDYVGLLVETGLLGVTLYVLLIGLLGANLVRRILISKSPGVHTILLSTFAVIAISGTVRGWFQHPVFWMVMALATLSCSDQFRESQGRYVKLQPY